MVSEKLEKQPGSGDIMDEKLGLSYFIPSNNGIWQVLGGSRNNELQFYTLTSPLLKSMSNKWLNNGQTPLTPLQRCASAFFSAKFPFLPSCALNFDRIPDS